MVVVLFCFVLWWCFVEVVVCFLKLCFWEGLFAFACFVFVVVVLFVGFLFVCCWVFNCFLGGCFVVIICALYSIMYSEITCQTSMLFTFTRTIHSLGRKRKNILFTYALNTFTRVNICYLFFIFYFLFFLI